MKIFWGKLLDRSLRSLKSKPNSFLLLYWDKANLYLISMKTILSNTQILQGEEDNYTKINCQMTEKWFGG